MYINKRLVDSKTQQLLAEVRTKKALRMRWQLLDIFGSCGLLALSVCFANIFFTSQANDGKVLVTTNDFGEGTFESVLVPTLLILGISAFVRMVVRIAFSRR